MQSVLYNKDLFTNIMGYLDANETRKIMYEFRGLLHYDYIRPTANQILLYGQVQSGKTSKIMDFITKYKTDKLKILIIQNNILMLSQYVRSLSQRGITYRIIEANDTYYRYNNEQVVITINNKFRLGSLNEFINHNKMTNHALILDESDQYLKRIHSQQVFKTAKDVLHVTATPFIYSANAKFQIDKVITIKPKLDYVGINEVKINEINTNPSIHKIQEKIINIIADDFLTAKHGLMLINCFSKVTDMKSLASILSYTYSNIPIIIFSNKTYMYLHSRSPDPIITKAKNIQTFTDFLGNVPHAIFIAGRLSNRGINYTNSTYTRYITHQISAVNGNYTSFIQKCRIFGNRTSTKSDIRPTLYVIITQPKHQGFITKLTQKINAIPNENFNQCPFSQKTVKELKLLCKEHKIKKYSKLKKNKIIELLKQVVHC